jgi:hypothetical protein
LAHENPFKRWTSYSEPSAARYAPHAIDAVEAVDVLEASLLNTDTPPSLSSFPSTQSRPKRGEAPAAGLTLDTCAIEQLANLIADNLSRLFEQNNVFADRLKLEELKVDNQLMARHIYSLLQKRGIQDKQVEHLQREQKRWKKLFWKLYLRQD